MAGDTTPPGGATRYVETTRGVQTYSQLAQLLAVTGAHGAFASRHAELLKELEASAAWNAISGTQRMALMSEEGPVVVG
jgi:hypothetical protein